MYCITCIPTGKRYVGSTKDPLQRCKQHASKPPERMRHDVHLYQPFTDFFSVTVLAHLHDKRDAERLKKLHISAYDTKNPAVGYNVLTGRPTQDRQYWAIIRAYQRKRARS